MKPKLLPCNLYGPKKMFGSNVSTAIIMIFLTLSSAPCALSQIPQGFNYQAIIRDGVTKQPIVSQPVLIRVTIENEIGTDIYQETHSLSTDEFGIISIIVGQGAPWGTSDFDEIDWNDEPLSIKTEVQYPVGGSYTEMGTAPLMSVPYAMVADSLGGPLKNLKVKGSATTPDTEALFEVKNTTGQTVFAVYNEGVRIYVNDQDAKGPKGGFAIGGFGMGKTIPHQYMFISGDSVRFNIDNGDEDKGPKGGFAIGGFGTVKGLTQKYLMVSNDSVRIYVDNKETDKGPKGGFAIGGYGTDKGKPQKLLTVSNDSVRIYINDGAKGPKGGFAIGGFDQAKGDGANVNFFNVSTDNTGIVSTAEPRILWYPLKNAFLAGQVVILDPDSVGLNSVATGFESRAKGAQSQAMGYRAIARGDYSTAIGKNALARRNNSFAFGDDVIAGNLNTFAFGKSAVASGNGSYAFGYNALASAQDAFAFGTGAEASGLGSFALGFIGRDSLGNSTGNTKATLDYAVAIGMGAQATKEGSFSIGLGSQADGEYSLAVGYKSKAIGWFSNAIGYRTNASGQNSTAFGSSTTASGGYSTAIGKGSIASGHYSTAIGCGPTSSGHTSTAMGYETIASGHISTAFGTWTTASGDHSTVLGRQSTAQAFCSLVIGRYNVIQGTTGSWVDTEPLFVAGNGVESYMPSNALTLYKDGNMTIAGTLTQSSDARFKNNFEEFKDVLPFLNKITPLYFEFIDNRTHPSGRQIGLIAQEVQPYFPELVGSDSQGFLSIDYSRLSVVLLQALKEQQKQIEAMKTEIEELKKK